MPPPSPSARPAFWNIALAAVFAFAGLCCRATAAPPQPIKVCLVSGSLEYKSNESLAEFQKFVEAHYPVRCSRAFLEGTDESHLPGLEHLDDCDTMLLFTRRLNLSGEELARFKRYCLAGRPIVGVRTASHAVQTWLELDKEVLGGNYHNHYPDGPQTEIQIVPAAANHPILQGFRPFRSQGSLYKNSPLPADDEVLLRGAIPDHTEPITWTRTYKGARIFYTALGHPSDFSQESFRRLLINALFWTAGRDVPAQ